MNVCNHLQAALCKVVRRKKRVFPISKNNGISGSFIFDKLTHIKHVRGIDCLNNTYNGIELKK
jgi:hypothetical protein